MRNREKWTAAAIAVTVAISSFAGAGISVMAEEEASGTAVDIVEVEGGLVQGAASDTEGVQVFKGVPFAADTSGENRFKEPQPVEEWEGVKVCDTWGDQVMQRTGLEVNPEGSFYHDEFYFDDSYDPDISENGLVMNIYTPAQSADENLPVLFYIHGGGNNHGNASSMQFNASEIAAKGAVVVVVQYRLSMFGFLSLPGLSAESGNGVSGNYAILDLIKALEWVQEYIAGFGGNPDQVMIYGQSAGAMNCIALLRTPLAEGLFREAMIESGFSSLITCSYADMETAQAAAEEAVIAALGLPEDTSSEDVLAELRSHDAQYYMDTLSADEETYLYEEITRASNSYVIDGYVFTEESVDLTREGALNGVNVIIGGASDEQTVDMGPGTMDLDSYAEYMSSAYGENYEDAYAAEDEEEAYHNYLDSISDLMLQTYIASAEYLQDRNDSDIYVYFFNQDLPAHTDAARDDSFFGSFHSSELWYTFSSMRDIEGQRPWTEADYALSDQMTDYILNFASTGNPNGGDLPEWQICSTENDGAFMWWTEGTSQCVTHANEARETINRPLALASNGLTEEDFQ